jgi:hypothetical protein
LAQPEEEEEEEEANELTKLNKEDFMSRLWSIKCWSRISSPLSI